MKQASLAQLQQRILELTNRRLPYIKGDLYKHTVSEEDLFDILDLECNALYLEKDAKRLERFRRLHNEIVILRDALRDASELMQKMQRDFHRGFRP